MFRQVEGHVLCLSVRVIHRFIDDDKLREINEKVQKEQARQQVLRQKSAAALNEQSSPAAAVEQSSSSDAFMTPQGSDTEALVSSTRVETDSGGASSAAAAVEQNRGLDTAKKAEATGNRDSA